MITGLPDVVMTKLGTTNEETERKYGGEAVMCPYCLNFDSLEENEGVMQCKKCMAGYSLEENGFMKTTNNWEWKKT